MIYIKHIIYIYIYRTSSHCERKIYILIIKPTRCTNFSNLFLENESLHVADSFSVHHQDFSTVHTAMVYVIQVMLTDCEQDQDGSPDDGQRNCPKHVDFYFRK